MSAGGWIGVDLDGTLAMYEGWKGAQHIGAPVKPMLDRVLRWRKVGREVRIMTARVFPIALWSESMTSAKYQLLNHSEREKQAIAAAEQIQRWCMEHVGEILPITCQKDYGMIELWDDRCVQVEMNTGRILGKTESLVV